MNRRGLDVKRWSGCLPTLCLPSIAPILPIASIHLVALACCPSSFSSPPPSIPPVMAPPLLPISLPLPLPPSFPAHPVSFSRTLLALHPSQVMPPSSRALRPFEGGWTGGRQDGLLEGMVPCMGSACPPACKAASQSYRGWRGRLAIVFCHQGPGSEGWGCRHFALRLPVW